MHLAQAGRCHRLIRDLGQHRIHRPAPGLLHDLKGSFCGEGRHPILHVPQRVQSCGAQAIAFACTRMSTRKER